MRTVPKIRDDITGKQILSAMEEKKTLEAELMEDEACPVCGHHHDHHHADDVFTSWGKETPRKYTKEEIEEALKVLADTTEVGAILRAKGMVPDVNGEWIFFDLVPGEYEIRKGTPEYTGRLCVIGTDLKEDKIMELFHLN